MFETVLIANRGEIAVRIMRTLRSLGVRSVAVYSDADADALHVREADIAVRIGPASALQSYLSTERIVEAALATGAQAVHPGYGFLAENASFARACDAAGLTFVGPPAEAIDAMGDKIRAKRTVASAGVPVVPGRTEAGLDDAELILAAMDVGLPVLLKPSAGGGGKGMRLVREAETLAGEISAARREARSAFGDDTLLVERYVERPRHIEIQVLADSFGNVVHLGERECSLQRRHQKVIEEAPSPLLSAEMRAAMGAKAVDAARACGYVNAGTVEFIVPADRPEEFFFIEMNTRLQVEHAVTELVYGLDLVELQLRVAAGERLALSQDDIVMRGHAIEARVYAEDPARGFLPTGGRVLALVEPCAEGVRVDSGLRAGAEVGSTYDPMLAKIVAWGQDREEARRRLDRALAETVVLGVTTNVDFLRRVLRHPEVAAGRLDTGLLERHLDELVSTEVPDEVLAAAALDWLVSCEDTGPVRDPWAQPGGWRVGGPAWVRWPGEVPGAATQREVRVRGRAADAEVAVAGQSPLPASARLDRLDRLDGNTLAVSYGGRTRRYTRAEDGTTLWLGAEGQAWALATPDPMEAARHHGHGTGGTLTSPMPGTVILVHVTLGDTVSAGQAVAIVEAMKMEHTITSPIAGIVTALNVAAGQTVAMSYPLAVITPAEE